MRRVLVFGARGWLGSKYVKHFSGLHGFDVRGSHADITDCRMVAEAIRMFNPDWVINADGMTRGDSIRNILGCEESEEAKERCRRFNIDGPIHIAKACKDFGVKMVHISTGNVFDGQDKVFTDQDLPEETKNFYCHTKATAEHHLTRYREVLILRPMFPFNGETHRKNLLYKLGQWRRIEMVTNSVTYIPDLLRVTALLMEREASGIRNIVQSEPLSWVGAVSRYREVLGPQFEGSRELVLPDERRSNAVLAPSVDIEMMLTPLETAVSSSLEEIRRRQLYLAA